MTGILESIGTGKRPRDLGLVAGMIVLALSAWTANAGETEPVVQSQEIPPAQLPNEMERANLYTVKTVPSPKAVLVLCPGCNDSGEEMVEDARWQAFAREQGLGLVGISYASDMDVLAKWRGYHIASQGSGQVLIDGIRKIYGSDLPLVMYGVSSGALFICQFVDWKPERVLAWSAYASGWGGEQHKQRTPPGLIACGEYDGSRYGAMLSYFKQGRAYGKDWLWVSLPKTDHEFSPPIERFTREYFSTILKGAKQGCWIDVDRELIAAAEEVASVPSVTGWLPGNDLLPLWRETHEP